MTAKKGKSKTTKVSSLKSKKLNAKQADQVKGGIIAVSVAPHKDWAAHKSPSGIKFIGGAGASWK